MTTVRLSSFVYPKTAISGVGDVLLLRSLDIPCYLLCNEQNNVPIPIPSYYTMINRSLLCDCQLQGRNYESL